MDIDVITSALRSEALTWDAAADAATSISSAADALRMSRLEAGIFQLVASEYEATTDHVYSRCREGAAELNAIADALRRNARAYDERDADVAQHVDGSY